jgi:hypothetical protein
VSAGGKVPPQGDRDEDPVRARPLAILALIAWPFVWLLSLPFRLVGITFSALFAFLRALFMLPARLLGGGRGAVTA